MESDKQEVREIMFVKLTLNNGRAIYVNPNLVSSVNERSDGASWVTDVSDYTHYDDAGFCVKESADTVVMLFESALKGGFVK